MAKQEDRMSRRTWLRVALLLAVPSYANAFGFPAAAVRIAPPAAIPTYPHVPAAVSTDTKEQSPSPSFDCDISGWVRAPDLFPGQRAYGEARLVANGSSCSEIVSWDLVLHMRERSVVRLPDPAINLPPRPVYNKTLQDAYYANQSSFYEPSWNNIISQGHASYSAMDRAMSPYDKAMEEYNAFMSNESIWQVTSAERIVFETSTALALFKQLDTVQAEPLKVIEKFGIAVPDCKFPPSHWGVDSYSEERTEVIAAETQLGYFFSMGLRNTSTIKVPAGVTVFGDAGNSFTSSKDATTPSSSSDITSSTIQLRPMKDRYYGDIDPFGEPELTYRQDETERAIPAYEIGVDAPRYLVRGQNTTLKVTVKSLNLTSNLLPSRLNVEAFTIPTYPWAAKLASTPEQSQRLLEYGGRGDSFDPHRSVHQRRARKVSPGDFEENPNYVGMAAPWFRGRGTPPPSAARLDEDQDTVFSRTFEVTVNVPEDLLPSHETTFVNFTSYLGFDLYARKPAKEDEQNNDLDDDNLWTGHPIRQKHEFSQFSGKLETRIVSHATEDEATGDVMPYYGSEACLAPKLLDHTARQDETILFKPVSTELVKESEQDRLLTHKYHVHDCGMRHNACGGRYEMAGDVWAMKLYREGKSKSLGSNRPKLVLQAP